MNPGLDKLAEDSSQPACYVQEYFSYFSLVTPTPLLTIIRHTWR